MSRTATFFSIVIVGLVVMLSAAGNPFSPSFTTHSKSKKNGQAAVIYAEFTDKVVYTLDTSLPQEDFINDCRKRGGTFNTCGSPCESDGQACIEVCAYTCSLK